MKSSRQILELPVLSIEEGKEIGQVKHLVLNPQKGTVDFILVEDGAWYLGLKALPFTEIQGIGEFALTVAGRSALSSVPEATGALELLETNLRLTGIKVLTKKGRLVGSISEYYVDENTGRIKGCQLVLQGSSEPAGIISDNLILTFGQDFLVVEENIEEKLLSELLDDQASGPETTSNPSSTPTTIFFDEAPASELEEEKSGQPSEALKLFEEQQRQYLLGKKVGVKITAENGEVIAEEGAVITEEIIRRAKAADKYILLTMNVKE